MNLILAIVIFFIIFFFITGVPGYDSSTIGYVIENTPAEMAGLEDGDKILMINGEDANEWNDVLSLISARPAEEISLLIERNGEELIFNIVTEVAPDSGRGMIGIGPAMLKYRFFASLSTSFERFGLIISSMFQVLTGRAPLDVAGPVGIIFVIGEVAQTGFINLLLLTALISISLGIMNLLPIPALDGGRLFFLLVEAVRGRKIDPEKEGFIHFIGFALLILLILFITYQDLLRWVISPGD
jgi:regulator of sigma E protease